MSRKQDKNRIQERRHAEAIKAKDNTKAAKRIRQRDTDMAKRASPNDLLKMKAEDRYRVDTARGRRLIARASDDRIVRSPTLDPSV